MGGGKGGGGCSLVGYGYTLTMLYAFCEKADVVSGWKVNDKIWWKDNSLLSSYPQSVQTKSLYTGKKGEVYHSDGSDHTNVTFYLQNYSPVSYPKNTIGYDIKLNNLCFAYMPNAFVGDNTTTVPRYNARLSRFYINNKNAKIGTGSVNPITVIKEIMQKYLKISNLDGESFNNAEQKCKEEGLGISFVMTTEKKVKDWIKEILRTIDGVLWFDTLTETWKIKLLRPNDDLSTVFELTEENTAKLELTSGNWSSLINEFTFKYSDINTGKTESFTVSNEALFNIIGYKISKVYTFQLVGEKHIMEKIASRIIKKNSTPLAQLKARISILDLPYIELGDVVKVNSTKLDIPAKLFRITKIGGDKEDDVYVDIEGIEDVWTVQNVNAIIGTVGGGAGDGGGAGAGSGAIDISELTPYQVVVKELPNYFVTDLQSKSQPITTLVTYPANYENNYEIEGSEKIYSINSNIIRKTSPLVFYYGLLQQAIGITTKARNPDFEILIKPYSDAYCHLPHIDLSEQQWQQLQWVLVIGNELFSIKKIEVIDDNAHTYKITGIIRLLDKRDWKSYTANTPVYIAKLDNTSNIVDYTIQTHFNIRVTCEGAVYNYSTKSQSKSNSISTTNLAKKLLPPDYAVIYTQGDTTYLKFNKKARGLNTTATFESSDNIIAGDKEEVGEENYVKIYYNYSNTLDVSLDSSRWAYITQNSNGFYVLNINEINNTFSVNITYSNIKAIQTSYQILPNAPILTSDKINVNKM